MTSGGVIGLIIKATVFCEVLSLTLGFCFQGHARSKVMVPNKRSHGCLYLSIMQTMSVSLMVYEIRSALFCVSRSPRVKVIATILISKEQLISYYKAIFCYQG